jgi:hypothetical protein
VIVKDRDDVCELRLLELPADLAEPRTSSSMLNQVLT